MKNILLDKNHEAIKFFQDHDEKIAWLIKEIGTYHFQPQEDYFVKLVDIIVGQQLSASAAMSIRKRMTAFFGKDLSAIQIRNCNISELRGIGISNAKAIYIKELSRYVLEGKINFGELGTLPDASVISELTKIKGIGLWSAEMFLIFSLGRLDVLSFGDIGIKRSIQYLYHLDEIPQNDMLMCLRQKWSPFCSVASLYLWEAIDRKIYA